MQQLNEKATHELYLPQSCVLLNVVEVVWEDAMGKSFYTTMIMYEGVQREHINVL